MRNQGGRDRISLPFFLDPSSGAVIEPLPLDAAASIEERQRWDHAGLSEFDGVYGDWLLAKASKVFPGLAGEVLPT